MPNAAMRPYALSLLLAALGTGVAHGQPHSLSTGGADGDITVGVDGYGAFGSNPGPDSSDGLFNVIGPAGPLGTIYDSCVLLRIGAAGARQSLTSGNTQSGGGGLPQVTVTGSATSGTSTFTITGLQFDLVQDVVAKFDGATRTGAMLTQTYTITNTTGAPISFELVRYLDPNRNVFWGGRYFAPGGEELMYSDENPINASLLGMTSLGGTVPATNRFQSAAVPALIAALEAGTDPTDTVVGDSNGDGLIDTGPQVNCMALRNVYVLAAGASTTYTTQTIWGTGAASSVFFPAAAPPPPPPPPSGGGIGFSEGTYHNTHGPRGSEGACEVASLVLRAPRLVGPYATSAGNAMVYNNAPQLRSSPPAMTDEAESLALLASAALLLAGVGIGGQLWYRRHSATRMA